METTTTIQELASEAAGYLVSRTREDGSEYIARADGSPEWVMDLAREAHGDMLPDDFRYRAISSALDFIAEGGDEDDGPHDFADTNTDVYTGALTAWLGSHLSRPGYCDEAASELGDPDDMIKRIQYGQYWELREVYGLVYEFLAKRADDPDDE